MLRDVVTRWLAAMRVGLAFDINRASTDSSRSLTWLRRDDTVGVCTGNNARVTMHGSMDRFCCDDAGMLLCLR